MDSNNTTTEKKPNEEYNTIVPTHIRKRSLNLLILASVLGSLSGAIYAPFYAIFVQGIGGDVLLAGISQSAYFVTAGLTALISGRIADKYGKRKMVVTGFVLLFAGDVMLVFVSSIETLILAEFVLGIGLSLTNPAWSGLFASLLAKGEESTYFGRLEFLYNIGFSVAAIFGALVIQYSGFTALFAIKALLHAGSVTACLRLPSLS
ncbi:hypothetical protein AUJ14_01310 [Candidatus Micrarchaeota archaeon CG1_02_55_22]|nr:MAG: hypothetical protein AUJ14_01310 [Candidatus Micrarchaeota archaeon CG1_02_55_22]